MSSGMMDLKSSPLVLSLSELYNKFPDIDTNLIEQVLVEERFDTLSSIAELNRRFRETESNNGVSELKGSYKSVELNIGLSNPHREVKVVRLDTDS